MSEIIEAIEVVEATVMIKPDENEKAVIERKPFFRKLEFVKADKLLALLVFPICYLGAYYFWLRDWEDMGIGVLLFVLCYGVGIVLYAKAIKQRISKEGIFWILIMEGTALIFAFGYNISLRYVLPLFLQLVGLYVPLVVFETTVMKHTDRYLLVDVIWGIIRTPFLHIHSWCTAIFTGAGNTKSGRNILAGVLGILVTTPLLLMIWFLLATADENFLIISENVVDFFGEKAYLMIWALICALPISCYVYSLLYGSARKREGDIIEKERVDKAAKKMAVIPGAAIYTVLTMILIMYGVFMALQKDYLIGGFINKLPEDATSYSSYANAGFFQLLVIVVLNLGIISAAKLLCAKEGKSAILRLFTAGMSIMTLALISTAMMKMYMYIQVYGLTPRRVFPTVFMVFLAVVFVLLLISQIRRVQVVRWSVLTLAGGFMALTLFNMDGFIASYDLKRYEEGTLYGFPEDVLLGGEMASVPAIYEAWETTANTEYRTELYKTAMKIKKWGNYNKDEHPSGSYNLASARGKALLNKMEEQTLVTE